MNTDTGSAIRTVWEALAALTAANPAATVLSHQLWWSRMQTCGRLIDSYGGDSLSGTMTVAHPADNRILTGALRAASHAVEKEIGTDRFAVQRSQGTSIFAVFDDDWLNAGPRIALDITPGVAFWTRPRGKHPPIDAGLLLRAAAPLVGRGQALQFWGAGVRTSSAHAAMTRRRLLDVLQPALPKQAADLETLCGGERGCQHYFWRTPLGQPDAILLLRDGLTFADAGRGKTCGRLGAPCAIAAL